MRVKNLPHAIDDIREVIDKCEVCCESKQSFLKQSGAQLIKATQLFERLSLDFKGSLQSSTKNHYMLTIIDEYSCFPFVFPCAVIDAKTVISCLKELFAYLVCQAVFVLIGDQPSYLKN